MSCRSTPFLWCLPKETVSSRQRKALFLPWRLHHSRERYKSVDYTFLARLLQGAGGGLGLSTCAPLRGEGGVGLPCRSTPFLLSCQKKRCRAAKEKRFEASTSPWWARPPLPFGSKPQRDKLVRQVGLYMVGRPGAQVSLTQSAVMLGLRVRGRGGRDPTAPVAAPKSAFLWGSTPFLCARAKKWGGTGSRGHNTPPKETAHT